MGVGIMRDYTLKQEDLKRLTHTRLSGKTYSMMSVGVGRVLCSCVGK
jgi:hypothetical protein